MDETFLISALSLFAGASLMPAGFLIMRNREIAVDRHYRVKGGMALVIAFFLIVMSTLFLLNTVAQDGLFLLVLIGLVMIVPFALIEVDKRLHST